MSRFEHYGEGALGGDGGTALVLCHTYIDGLGGTGKLVCPWMALAGKPPVAPNGFPTSPLTRQLRRDGALECDSHDDVYRNRSQTPREDA